VRHAAQRVADWAPRSWKRLLVVPEHKLMFCFIEKNACSQFNGLMNDLNGVHGDRLYFGSSALSHFNWTQAELEEALTDSSWYKAVFLRDPMERLLSAFVSKCLPPEEGSALEGFGSSCLFYENQAASRQPPKFSDFVEMLARKVGDEQRPECEWGTPEGCQQPHAYDPHFVRQTDFCGGVDLNDYDFVGDLGGNVSQQVKRMLMEVGAAADLLSVDKYFPPEGVRHAKTLQRPEHTLSHASDPAVSTGYYKDPETVSLTHAIYAEDYKARNFGRESAALSPSQ